MFEAGLFEEDIADTCRITSHESAKGPRGFRLSRNGIVYFTTETAAVVSLNLKCFTLSTSTSCKKQQTTSSGSSSQSEGVINNVLSLLELYQTRLCH